MTGAVLGGRYRLTRPIGSGGMAVVWEARDEILGREVAVKVLAGHHLGDPQSRELIRHEARAAASLSHPNIAQVHDYGEMTTAEGVFPFVVMELIRGETLQTRASRADLPPRVSMRVCAEVAAALAAAHGEGIVHRDVKPANVMLAPTGAKVVDFGIAAAVAPGRTDDDFEVLGTPAYLAPERLLSDVVEPASDVYALAVLLYQLLAGCLPWTSETTTQMLTAHIYIEPEPLGPTDGVPDYVVDLCNRCLAKDPTLRPSAREVATLLAHGAHAKVAIADLTLDEPAPSGRRPGVQPPPGPAPFTYLDPARDEPPAPGPAPAPFQAPVPAPVWSAGRAPESTAGPATAPPAGPAAGSPAGPTTESPTGPATGSPTGPATGSPTGPATGSPTGPATGSPTGPATGSPGDPAPENRQSLLARRWAVAGAAGAVILLALAIWLFWPHDDSRGTSASGTAAGGNPAFLQPSAPAAGGPTEPPSTGTSARPVPATPTGTAPATRPSVPAAAGPGGPTVTAHPTHTTPTASPTPSATPVTRELTSPGGSVRATCPAPATAEILSAEPTQPYKVLSVDSSPGPSPTAVFKHGKSRVTMTVTCRAGVPAKTDTVS